MILGLVFASVCHIRDMKIVQPYYVLVLTQGIDLFQFKIKINHILEGMILREISQPNYVGQSKVCSSFKFHIGHPNQSYNFNNLPNMNINLFFPFLLQEIRE